MNKKYELTSEKISVDGHTLYRIRALRQLNDIRTRDLGGFVESEFNLSHEGCCWVDDNAMVFGDAWVCGDAVVGGNAVVEGGVWVGGDSRISGDAMVFGDAVVFGNTKLDSGIWNQQIEINDNCYLISTTLRKLLMR